jgi:hypothetical protein
MQNDDLAGSDLPIGLVLYLRESELALRWRMSERTLQRWRQAGKVPRYLRLGGRVLYPIADVLAFEAGRVSARRHRVQP